MISTQAKHYEAQARARLDSLTKPIGSLGRLEDLAAQWVAIRAGAPLGVLKKAVYVFAADHGVTAEGVSAYPAEVTQQMVLNFLRGGAAVNVLARLHRASVHVVDVGVNADLSGHAGLLQYKVRRGSRNMLREPAMSDEELAAALSAGSALAEDAFAQGIDLLAIGEMGIGNTTAASVITAALTGLPPESVTGRGTGVDDAAYKRKCAVVAGVLQRHFASGASDREILRCGGGLEIAAMAGMVMTAARRNIAIVMDGFISTAAAALACGIEPATRPCLFAGHQSQEPGHRALLRHLEIAPILDLDMRLGEGTGAVLAMPVLESALRLYQEMATFTSAGVSEASA